MLTGWQNLAAVPSIMLQIRHSVVDPGVRSRTWFLDRGSRPDRHGDHGRRVEITHNKRSTAAREIALGVVLVDQDGSLADFEQGLLDAFRARNPGAPFIALADRRGFYAREQYPSEWVEAVDTIMRTEGFYRDLPSIRYASAALEEMLEAGHDEFLCTSPLTGSRWCVPEKLAGVERHLSPAWLRRTIITPDKTLVGDRLQPCVLVDDRPAIKGRGKPAVDACALRRPVQPERAGTPVVLLGRVARRNRACPCRPGARGAGAGVKAQSSSRLPPAAGSGRPPPQDAKLAGIASRGRYSGDQWLHQPIE